jgi:hypothetical protein
MSNAAHHDYCPARRCVNQRRWVSLAISQSAVVAVIAGDMIVFKQKFLADQRPVILLLLHKKACQAAEIQLFV